MTPAQIELFTDTDFGSAPATEPRTVPEVIACGYRQPDAENPYLWSSTFWEAFMLGQHLRRHGVAIDGFRKSRGSTYKNASGLAFRFYYDPPMWCITAI